MKISFLGTASELDQVAGRPTLLLLGLHHTPRVVAFTLLRPSIIRHPYRELYRLRADLAPLDERGQA